MFKINNDLFLRPIIGVFVFGKKIRKLLNQETSRKVDMLRKANNQAKTTIYYFTSKDVDYNNQLITGTWFNETTKLWELREFPFPDIIYSRRRDAAHKFRDNEKIKNIKCINTQYYFDKWDVYTKLMRNEKISPHIPVTKLFRYSGDIKDMFEKVNTIYLKSFKQNNGKGIMCIKKTGATQGSYIYSYYKKGELVVEEVDSFDTVIRGIMDFFKGTRFLIQQGINLLSIDGNITDIRSDVQRNGKGELEIVAHSIRVASNQSPITNTHTDPEIYQFEEFFKKRAQWSDSRITALKKKLESLLKVIYEDLEFYYGSFGEMGIDTGIDEQGNIWFIESNAKPGKNSFWVYDEEVVLKGFLNPLEYAKHIYYGIVKTISLKK